MLSLCKVTDSLFISNSRSACDKSLLAQERITFCLNVSRQQPFPNAHQIQTLRIPVFDDPSEDLYKYFDPCNDAIESVVQNGGKCLVYCKNGRSRSAAICTAHLMRHQNLSLKESFEESLGPPVGFYDDLPEEVDHRVVLEDLQIPGEKFSQLVKIARPVAEPNPGFWSQLQKYEEHLQMQHRADPSQKNPSQSV